MTAPARLQFATGGLSLFATRSLKAGTPLGVATPSWSMFSLIVTGTPCRGPRASPRRTAASARSAAARAWSASSTVTAFRTRLTASQRHRSRSMKPPRGAPRSYTLGVVCSSAPWGGAYEPSTTRRRHRRSRRAGPRRPRAGRDDAARGHALGPQDRRPHLDHRLHRPQSRLPELRHAVLDGRQG